jgi:hypothetical protein
MPRRSAADLSTIRPPLNGRRPKLSPTSPLTSSEQTLFNRLQAANGHLCSTDEPLLTSFVQSISRAHQLGRDSKRVADWERACRTMMALARSLRMTQQSVDAKTAGRRVRESQERSAALQTLLDLNDECNRPWDYPADDNGGEENEKEAQQ